MSALDIALIGVVGTLVSAVIAAALSGFFLLWHQRNQGRDQMRAAARAVLSEMLANAKLACHAASVVQPQIPFESAGRFSRAAWSEQLPLVAQLLNWDSLTKVRGAYDSGSAIFGSVGYDLVCSAPAEHACELQELFVGVGKEFLTAIESFVLAGLLNENETANLKADLAGLRQRIASS